MTLHKVTAFNPLTGKRFTVIDKITLQQAQHIKKKFGSKKLPFFYLPQLKIEDDI